MRLLIIILAYKFKMYFSEKRLKSKCVLLGDSFLFCASFNDKVNMDLMEFNYEFLDVHGVVLLLFRTNKQFRPSMFQMSKRIITSQHIKQKEPIFFLKKMELTHEFNFELHAIHNNVDNNQMYNLQYDRKSQCKTRMLYEKFLSICLL